jgi:tetratricopeptide (TPR) repeat protein
MSCTNRRFSACIFSILALVGGVSQTWGQDKAVAEPPKETSQRLDLEIREDFFAGFEGDEERLAVGIKKCEDELAKNEKNAEAMVWLGAGEVFKSGRLFSKGDVVNGMAMWQKGSAKLDKAVELEPTNIGVLIPRAAVLMPASRGLPKPIKDQVLKSVLADFTRVYELQKNELDKIGEHPLGELRMGLADIHRSLGQIDKSREHLEALKKELPDTEYSERADKWLAAKPTAKLAHQCIGCHTK